LRLNYGEHETTQLQLLAGSSGSGFGFLGYAVDLAAGEIRDSLRRTPKLRSLEFAVLQTLLVHYSRAEPGEKANKLVKFGSLPGGLAYEKAFMQRAVQPIAEAFGSKPEKLMECAKAFGGVAKAYGDSAVEIFGLPRIPLVIILWRGSEFSAEASMLFDESASRYLPTEDLAVLGELTTSRLIEALKLTC
jgi:Domain of unknown function (DUF3786)